MKLYAKLFWALLHGFILLPTIAMRDTQLVSMTTRRGLDEPQFEKPIGNHTFHIGREAMLGCSVVNLGKHKNATDIASATRSATTLRTKVTVVGGWSGSTNYTVDNHDLQPRSNHAYQHEINYNWKWHSEQVGWLRAEDQTVLSLHDKVVLGGRYSVTLDSPRTWQLRIRPLKAEDRGCYMCQINTQPSMKWQIGCIDVYIPPDIINEETSADVAALEMDNVTLVCRASGHPPPKITWRREDHEPMLLKKIGGRDFYKVENYVGSSLPLWRVDRRQMGAFLCIASNDVPPAVSKRITLLVNFSPTVIVPNQLLGAPLGTDVVLECTIEAHPNTINYWLKNRGEMLLDGPKYTITEERSSYRVQMQLTIRKFARNDIGTYNCVSTNSLGKSEGTLRLYEIKLYPSSQSSELNHNVIGPTDEAVKLMTAFSEANSMLLKTFYVIYAIVVVIVIL